MGRVIPLPHLVVLGLLPAVVELYHVLGALRGDQLTRLPEVLAEQSHAPLEHTDFVRAPLLQNGGSIKERWKSGEEGALN